MDLIKKLEELRALEQALSWQGTFADYFEIVKANPQVAQLSHARIFDMITSAGVEEGKGGHATTNSSTERSSAWTSRCSRWSNILAPVRSGLKCASASSS